MAYGDGRTGERWPSAALTGAAVAALGYALVSGFTVALPTRPHELTRLLSFQVAPPPPPPPERPPPPHRRTAEREGASAPPNLKSRATPVQVPPPPIRLRPPPVTVAPIPAAGLDASSGAALVAGPGTGAGGIGNGTGSGDRGDGAGAGGIPAMQINEIRRRDLPDAARQVLADSPQQFVVRIRFTVGIDGRVGGCSIARSSGSAVVDQGTCEAVTARLRFRPERDARGRAVPVTFSGDHIWRAVDGEAPPGRGDDG